MDLHPLIPDFIYKNYADSQMRGDLRGACLFADISGFTHFTNVLMDHGQHGAEVLASVMRSAFEPMNKAVFEFGGFVASQSGDAFTAIFEDQGDSLETCQRALAAAQEMQNFFGKNRLFKTPYGEFDITLKVGVAYNEISWAILEAQNQKRAAYYFKGPAIENSTQAEKYADPGEIILDPEIRSVLGDWVPVESTADYYLLTAPVTEFPDKFEIKLYDADPALAERFNPNSVLRRKDGGEFRQIVNLFISLPTIRTDEQLAVFLQTCFILMEQYGGLMNRLDFGDKGVHMLLFWGMPVAFENDINRALRFVLDLQSKTVIPIKAGVTYRVAYAGFIGSSLKEEYTAYGRGVNLASRYMTEAPRGEVWVDEEIASRIQNEYELEDEGEMTFKGFLEPQRVFALLEHKDEIETKFSHPFVGREAELAQLATHINPIFSGDFAGVILVRGEAGIGKTRLLDEFINRVQKDHVEPVQVFQGVCDEILRGSLNPIRYWLRQYFGFSDYQVETRNKRNFNRKLDDLITSTTDQKLAAELDRTRSFLGALLGIQWTDSLYEKLDAEKRYENTLSGLLSLIRCESIRNPTIFLLEDIHWIDRDTESFMLTLLGMLTKQEHLPFAVIMTARPERRFSLGDHGPLKMMGLKAFEPDFVLAQTEAMLGSHPSEGLVELVREQSDGNPFFIEQIIYYLQDNGLISIDGAEWQLNTTPDSVLPRDIRSLLTASFDRLPEALKISLQTAAVLGKNFDIELFAELIEPELHTQEMLDQGSQNDLWSQISDSEYQFNHAMMWEVAYRLQLHARREVLHARALTAAETIYENMLPSKYGELAHHAVEAGVTDKALAYLKLAGGQAVSNYQNVLAINYFSKALQFTAESDNGQQFELVREIVQLNIIRGDSKSIESNLAELDRLARLSTEPEKRVITAYYQADYAFSISRMKLVIEILEGVFDQLNSLGDEDIIFKSYSRLSQALKREGKVQRGIEIAQMALDLAVERQAKRYEGLLLNSMGLLLVAKQDYFSASDYFERSFDIGMRLGDINLEWLTLINLGMVTSFFGDYSNAYRYYRQSLEIARKIGNRIRESANLIDLGWLEGLLGNFDQAREYLIDCLDIARSIGDRYYELYALINLSANALAREDVESALEYASSALILAEEINERSGEAWAYTYIAHSQHRLHEQTKALASYQSALVIREELNQPALLTEPQAGIAWILEIQGDHDGACQAVASIQEYLEGGGTLDGTENPLWVTFTCYRVLKSTEPDRALQFLETTHNELISRSNHIEESDLRKSYLENIPLHRQILEAWRTRHVGFSEPKT